jgi:dynactin complex subunit
MAALQSEVRKYHQFKEEFEALEKRNQSMEAKLDALEEEAAELRSKVRKARGIAEENEQLALQSQLLEKKNRSLEKKIAMLESSQDINQDLMQENKELTAKVFSLMREIDRIKGLMEKIQETGETSAKPHKQAHRE